MRIGIDARELTGRTTGVGRYLAELLREWSSPAMGIAGRHRFVLYSAARLGEDLDPVLAALGAESRVVPGTGGTRWEQLSLAAAANRDGLGAFFAPGYTAPVRARCPVVLTIHDLSFFAHPEWFRWREGVRRREVTRRSAEGAAAILTDSEFSRGEIARHLGITGARVRVVPLGAGAPDWFAGPNGPGRGDAPDAREAFVLYAGSIFNRRRVPDLVSAFPAVAAAVPGARLDIVGENRTFPFQDIEALGRKTGLGDRIRVRSYVPEAELANAFRRASAFVFLSEYEGFGLTPLEALACGVPVVLLDTPVAREVCGAAALYVAPDDIAGLSKAITSLLVDADARRALLDEGARVLGRYSWAAAARATLETIESAGA